MTINNLASGVASGAIGIGPALASACALVASFALMAGGFFLGRNALGDSAGSDPPFTSPAPVTHRPLGPYSLEWQAPLDVLSSAVSSLG